MEQQLQAAKVWSLASFAFWQAGQVTWKPEQMVPLFLTVPSCKYRILHPGFTSTENTMGIRTQGGKSPCRTAFENPGAPETLHGSIFVGCLIQKIGYPKNSTTLQVLDPR